MAVVGIADVYAWRPDYGTLAQVFFLSNRYSDVKILVDENMPYARELFSRLGNVKAVPGRPIPVNELDDADALMVRSVTKVNEALLAGKAGLSLSGPQRQGPIMWMINC